MFSSDPDVGIKCQVMLGTTKALTGKLEPSLTSVSSRFLSGWIFFYLISYLDISIVKNRSHFAISDR